MKALCLAIGNSLRGDDGVAHRVAGQLGQLEDVVVSSVFQLTPELAPEVARAEIVVFVDADVNVVETTLEPVVAGPAYGGPIGHSMSPREIVRLAERLYGFCGRAFLCRIPVESFEGELLSATAEAGASAAVALLSDKLRERCS